MKESELREKMKNGWIHAIATFEIAGKPKQHVEESLDKYLENIQKDERIIIVQEEREEAIEHDDGIFSAFAELDIIVESLETFTWLCLNFSPASIEIIEPDVLKIQARDLTNWLNDLLSKLHEVASEIRTERGSKEHLVVGMNQLIKNSIILALESEPASQEELSKKIGVVGEQMEQFLTHLEEKGKIVSEDGTYRLP